MPLPPKGTPQRAKRDKYQLEYRRNYKSFHLMLDVRNPRDTAILKALDELPYKTKTEFIKRSVESALGLTPPKKDKAGPADSFIAELDNRD